MIGICELCGFKGNVKKENEALMCEDCWEFRRRIISEIWVIAMILIGAACLYWLL